MPLVRFLGFPTGSSVSLVAGQGAESADIAVAPWNVARTTEALAIALTRQRPEFRRAPEPIWLEAMPTGFQGLTPRAQVPSPAGPADWTNGPGTYPGFGPSAMPETDAPVMIRIASVAAGATPEGLLFEAGGPSAGLAAAFDASGDLVIGAGAGAATGDGEGAVFLRIGAPWFADATVDVWLALDPETGRMKAYVVDAVTQAVRTVARAAGNPLLTVSGPDVAALFAGGEDGGWWDVSDPSTLAQNSDGTGAVSVGDPVGYVADKSGNGRHLTAEGDARPILRQTASGLHYLDFDGIDDVMVGPTYDAITPTGVLAGMAMQFDTLDQQEDILMGQAGGGNRSWQIANPLVGRISASVKNEARSNVEARYNLMNDLRDAPMSIVLAATTADPAIAGVKVFLNGAEGDVGVSATGFDTRTDFIEVMGDASVTDGARRVDGRFYGGIVVNRGVTEAERLTVQAWLDSLLFGGTEVAGWADEGGVGVGQANGDVRAGVATGAFTGTMGDVSIWGGQLPADFGEDRPVRYEPEFHEIFYQWDCVRSDGLRLAYTAPQNVPDAFRDASRRTGRLASFVVTEPGVWTISCTARQIKSVEPLTFVEVSRQVQITVGPSLFGPTEGDPIWNADNTIVMCADGDFTGAPTGQHLVYAPAPSATYRAAVLQAAANADIGDGTRAIRILLKRGEGQGAPISGEWYNGSVLHDNLELAGAGGIGTSRFDHVVVGTWGSGANPVTDGLQDDGSTNKSSLCERFVWSGIDIQGSLDHLLRDYTGGDADKDLFWPKVAPGMCYLIDRCNVRDRWGIGVHIDAVDPELHAAAPSLVVVHDCGFDRVMDYSVFGDYGQPGMRVAIVGNRMVHPADAPVYLQSEGPGLGEKNHGGIRMGGNGDLVIDGNDIFTRFGWTANSPWPDGTPRVAAQPAARIGAADPTVGARIQFTRNAYEGDSSLFSLGRLDADPTSLANIVVDGNLAISGAGGGSLGTAEGGGITVRNNLLVHNFVAGGLPVTQMAAYRMSARNGVMLEQIAWEPVAHYGNTMILLGGNGGTLVDEEVDIADDVEVYTVSNNVLHAPGLAGQQGHVDLAPFDATKIFDTRYLGRWEGLYDAALVTALATPDGTASLYAPLPGSAVEGGATAGYVPLFDIVSTPRWPLATLGAVQVQAP